ncbi:hypothetical protein JTB14_007300 [Gonioctena quinquepunctata]|nr:hypothetical protein JTB14_007300 [Gonioctena quinquepunctata]
METLTEEYVNAHSEDLSYLCRACSNRSSLTCLIDEPWLLCIFKSILRLANIDINLENNIPDQICDKCLQKLEQISVFISLIRFSDKTLRQALINKECLEKEKHGIEVLKEKFGEFVCDSKKSTVNPESDTNVLQGNMINAGKDNDETIPESEPHTKGSELKTKEEQVDEYWDGPEFVLCSEEIIQSNKLSSHSIQPECKVDDDIDMTKSEIEIEYENCKQAIKRESEGCDSINESDIVSSNYDEPCPDVCQGERSQEQKIADAYDFSDELSSNAKVSQYLEGLQIQQTSDLSENCGQHYEEISPVETDNEVPNLEDTGSIIEYCKKITIEADKISYRSLSIISDSHTDDENDVLRELSQDSDSEYVPSGFETEIEDSGTDISQKIPRISADRQRYSKSVSARERPTLCPLCFDDVKTHFSRHLMRHHKNNKEVMLLQTLPPRSKERLAIVAALRKQGYFHLNVEKDILNPVKRSKKPDAEYFACTFCLGHYNKKHLYKHVKTCKSKPETELKPGKNSSTSLKLL